MPTARPTTATRTAGRRSWASWPPTSMPPDIEAIAEQVFTALADPSRRAILAALASEGPATATDLAGRLPITRQAIAKHLALLAEAGLVTAEPGERRRVRYRLRSAPMQVAQQFLAALARDWDAPLVALKDHLDRSSRGRATTSIHETRIRHHRRARENGRDGSRARGNARPRRRGLGRRGPADARDGHGGGDQARLVRVLHRRVGGDDGGHDAARRRTAGAEARSGQRPRARRAAVRRVLPCRVDPRGRRGVWVVPAARDLRRRCGCDRGRWVRVHPAETALPPALPGRRPLRTWVRALLHRLEHRTDADAAGAGGHECHLDVRDCRPGPRSKAPACERRHRRAIGAGNHRAWTLDHHRPVVGSRPNAADERGRRPSRPGSAGTTR